MPVSFDYSNTVGKVFLFIDLEDIHNYYTVIKVLRPSWGSAEVEKTRGGIESVH